MPGWRCLGWSGTSAPYRAGLNHLGDVTRDMAHAPKIAQFRIELRGAIQWLAARDAARLASRCGAVLVLPIRAGLRLWEIVLLSAVIQWGMLPLLAEDFHRVSLAGPSEQYSSGFADGHYCAAGICALACDVFVGATGAGAGQGSRVSALACCLRPWTGSRDGLGLVTEFPGRRCGWWWRSSRHLFVWRLLARCRRRAEARPGGAFAACCAQTFFGMDRGSAAAGAGGAGGDLSFCAAIGARRFRSHRAGCGPGRFDFCGLS